MPDDRWQMPDGECRMADDGCQVRSGGCGDGESGEPTPQAPSEEMPQQCWDLLYLYGQSWPGAQANILARTSGGCGEGEPERNEPTQEACPAPEKVPTKLIRSQ